MSLLRPALPPRDEAATPAGRRSGEIVAFRKEASRLTCIRAIRTRGHTAFLLDIGERYIVSERRPTLSGYIEVGPDGACRTVGIP